MKKLMLLVLSCISCMQVQTAQRFQKPTQAEVEERIRHDAARGKLTERDLNMHLRWAPDAQIDARNADGKSALDLAIENNHTAVAKLLRDRQSVQQQ